MTRYTALSLFVVVTGLLLGWTLGWRVLVGAVFALAARYVLRAARRQGPAHHYPYRYYRSDFIATDD